jgi:hypothetical protein
MQQSAVTAANWGHLLPWTLANYRDKLKKSMKAPSFAESFKPKGCGPLSCAASLDLFMSGRHSTLNDRRKRDQKRDRRRRHSPRRPASGLPSSVRRGDDSGASQRISVRRVPDADIWELVYPPKVLRREEDMEEVRAMIDAGEIDAAVDELRWLLSGCRELLEAHRLLGEIALTDNDLPLAQAHFGYAYEMGQQAIRQASDYSGPLPYARPANQAFLEAGKGLAYCLRRQNAPKAAEQIVRQLMELDPSDPLKVRELGHTDSGK